MSRPWVTWLLVAANGVVFAAELVLGDNVEPFFRRWGLVAADVQALLQGDSTANPAVLVTLATSLFVHAGWLHLLVNLVYLAIFGTAVEAALGTWRFLGLYFVAGIVGGLVHVVTMPLSEAPAIGSSAAISGLIAAHLALFPGASLSSVAPMVFFSPAANVPVSLLLGLWLLAQVISGLASPATAGNVAWWAHLGGFVGGLAFAQVARPRRQTRDSQRF
jgi:membrane associated rhomboid family serine protease